MDSLKRHIPNVLSVSRIFAAALFVLVYDNTSLQRFIWAVAIAFAALGTDFLDGHLARKWNVTSRIGYFLDGLGDKTFHLSILLVIFREGPSSAILIWLLIAREVALYALRGLDSRLVENLLNLRQFSRYHAFFIRIYFGAFFMFDWLRFAGPAPQGIMMFGDASGWIAVGIGYFAIARLIQSIVRES